ncbi:MAG: hypothetical protein ACFFCD_02600 [Promethearchaeota archaeon]
MSSFVTSQTLLIIVPILIIYLLCVGDTFLLFLSRVLRNGLLENQFYMRFPLALALGTVITPIIIFFLSIVHLLNFWSAFILFVFFFIIRISQERVTLLRFKEFFDPKPIAALWTYLREKYFIVLYWLIFAGALFLRLYPLLGLYAPPADDPKMHVLLTQLIVETNGFPETWGIYAPKGYTDAPVMYFLMFHGICAYIHFLTTISVVQTVLIITNVYSALITLGMFYLSMQLFKNENSHISALFTAFFVAFISNNPLRFFGWGGNVGLATYFVSLTTLGFLIKYFFYCKTYESHLDRILVGGLLLGGLISMHPLDTIVIIGCATPFLLYLLVKQWSFQRSRDVLILYVLSFLIGLLSLYKLFLYPSSPEIQQFIIEQQAPFWKEKQIIQPEHIWALLSLKQSTIVYFLYLVRHWIGTRVVLFAIIGVLTFIFTREWRKMGFLLSWITLQSFFIVNGPYGLFFIQFPQWYNFLPDRFLLGLALPLSILAGYGLFSVIQLLLIFHRTLIKTSGDISKLSTKKTLLSSVVPLAIVLIFAWTSIGAYYQWNFMMESKELSPVTKADYEAFLWIKENTHTNATFFVTYADAGQWITVFAQRRVSPLFINQNEKIYLENEIFGDTIIPLMLENPNDPLALALLEKQGITHIYIGAKTIFGRQQPDPGLFGEVNYECTYMQNNVWIFQLRKL